MKIDVIRLITLKLYERKYQFQLSLPNKHFHVLPQRALKQYTCFKRMKPIMRWLQLLFDFDSTAVRRP